MLVYFDSTTKNVLSYEIIMNSSSAIPTGRQDGIRYIGKKSRIKKIVCVFGKIKATGNFVFQIQKCLLSSTSGTISYTDIYASPISVSLVADTLDQYRIITPSSFPDIEEDTILALNIVSNGASVRAHFNASLFLEEEF